MSVKLLALLDGGHTLTNEDGNEILAWVRVDFHVLSKDLNVRGVVNLQYYSPSRVSAQADPAARCNFAFS